MRVRIDTNDKSLPPLRAGMSVEVDVDTGHARGLPHFLTALFGLRSEHVMAARRSGAEVANRGAITVCVILATLMQALDTTIANVALPYMQGSVSASQDQIDWVLTSYIVAAAIMTPPTGFLAGRFGLKRLLPRLGRRLHGRLDAVRHGADAGQIVLFRVCRALFGAALVPLSQTVLLNIYPQGAAGLRHGALGRRRDGRPGARPGARRLADRELQLALRLLHQPAGRHPRLLRHDDVPAGDARNASRRSSTGSASARSAWRSAHCRSCWTAARS